MPGAYQLNQFPDIVNGSSVATICDYVTVECAAAKKYLSQILRNYFELKKIKKGITKLTKKYLH